MTLKRSRMFVAFVFPVICLVVMLGCSKSDEGTDRIGNKAKDDSPIIAKVGRGSVTVSDMKEYLSDKSVPNLSRVPKEQFEKLLDERIFEELLYQEALRVGLDKDPEVERSIRQMLTARVMDEHMEKEVWKKEISEETLQKYYEDHWAEFNRPDQVRLSEIFVAVPAGATDEQRAELKKKAETIHAKAVEMKQTRFGFGSLIREYSETPEKYAKGDTGFFDRSGAPVGLDVALAEAAFGLERVGDLAPQVIEAADGYHVVMLTGKRSGVNIALENVRHRLTQRIRRELADKAEKTYLDGLKAKAKIEVDEKVAGKFLEELGTQKAKERGPGAAMPAPQGDTGPPALPDR